MFGISKFKMKTPWVHSIFISLILSFVQLLPATAAAPAIGGLTDQNYTAGSDATQISTGITIASGVAYDGNYIEFSIGSSTSTDVLNLVKVTSASTVLNEVSVVGTVVYIGDGTNAVPMGSVDLTKNGASGQPLRINFAKSFLNSGFELGDSTSWTFVNSRVDIGVTIINGQVSSDADNDYSPTSANPQNDDRAPATLGTYTSVVQTSEKSEGSYALRLQSSGMTTGAGCDVVHGPAAYSSTFALNAGDKLYFDWSAVGGADAWDAYGYLLNMNAPYNQIELLDATGPLSPRTNWATNSTTISTAGNYSFVFINGTWDQTCGRAAGGTLYIDNIRIVGQNVTDAMVEKLAKLITYKSTATNPTTPKVVTVKAVAYDDDGAGSATTTSTFNINIAQSSTSNRVILPSSLVTFAQNGADNNSYPQSETLGETKTLWKNVLTRSGYTFVGWNTKADGSGVAYSDQSSFKFDSPYVTLYAQWKLIQIKPTITWPTPLSIQEGTPISTTQLNALASVPGTYTYSPAAGSLLSVGEHTLKVTFVPTDAKYETIEATVEIEVLAKAKINWTNPAAIVEGTSLSSTQLNATASVPGSYSYSPAIGIVLPVGNNTLKVTFTPTDTRLSAVNSEVTIDVTAKPAPGAPVSPTYSVTGFPKTTINWGSGKDAATYTVVVDGKSVCSVAVLTCDVAKLLGPRNTVTVTSVATNLLTSEAIPAKYVAPSSALSLSSIYFDTASSVIKSAEAAKLRTFANAIKLAGFNTLTVHGHTDPVPGVDNQKLSLDRANATITYLKRLLPGVSFKIGGFAATEPVADNATEQGRAANRRAEVLLP